MVSTATKVGNFTFDNCLMNAAGVYCMTKEELAEVERQSGISELQNQIQQKKDELAKTDYIPVKLYEYFLAGKECEEYDIDEIHAQRQKIRDEINSLELQLKKLTE